MKSSPADWSRNRESHPIMRFHDGYAYSVKHTPYPERDALNRQTVIKNQKISESDLAN